MIVLPQLDVPQDEPGVIKMPLIEGPRLDELFRGKLYSSIGFDNAPWPMLYFKYVRDLAKAAISEGYRGF